MRVPDKIDRETNDNVYLYAEAFEKIGNRWGLDKQSSFYDEDDGDENDISVIESVAHDMGHALVFGFRMSSLRMSQEITGMLSSERDQHEVLALAVEIRGLAQLGILIDEELLIEYASVKTLMTTPVLAKSVADAMMSSRVDLLTLRFVEWVKEAIQ